MISSILIGLTLGVVVQAQKEPIVIVMNRDYVAIKPEISSLDPASQKYGDNTQDGSAYYNLTRFERRYLVSMSVGSKPAEGLAYFDSTLNYTKVTSTLSPIEEVPFPVYDPTESTTAKMLTENVTVYEGGGMEVNFTEYSDSYCVWANCYENFKFMAYKSDKTHKYENVISLARTSYSDDEPTLMNIMKDKGFIEKEIFTFYGSFEADSGSVFFGSYTDGQIKQEDSNNMTVLGFQNFAFTNQNEWSIELQNVTFLGEPLFDGTWKAVLSIGDSYIRVPVSH